MFPKWFKKVFTPNSCAPCAGDKTLSDVDTGKSVRVKCLQGDASVCNRLREMGFGESAVVEKVSDSGALICKVCGTKVIISKGLAKNIIVNDLGDTIMSENRKKVLLSQLTVGQKGIIHDFLVESDDCERIEEMGVTPGEEIEIVRYAPMGDPIEIKIRGYLLSMRRSEAEKIKVKRLP